MPPDAIRVLKHRPHPTIRQRRHPVQTLPKALKIFQAPHIALDKILICVDAHLPIARGVILFNLCLVRRVQPHHPLNKSSYSWKVSLNASISFQALYIASITCLHLRWSTSITMPNPLKFHSRFATGLTWLIATNSIKIQTLVRERNISFRHSRRELILQLDYSANHHALGETLTVKKVPQRSAQHYTKYRFARTNLLGRESIRLATTTASTVATGDLELLF